MYEDCASEILNALAEALRSRMISRFQGNYGRFMRKTGVSLSEEDILQTGLVEAERLLVDPLVLLPRQEAISAINNHLQQAFGVAVTSAGILAAMRRDEVPEGIASLICALAAFCETSLED